MWRWDNMGSGLIRRRLTQMKTDELDFELPPELIAQTPSEKRGDSRLLHYQRKSEAIVHRMFAELPGLLRAGDLLAFNDARVIPARFVLRKETGGLVDGLFLREERAGEWRVMLRNAGSTKKLIFEEVGIATTVLRQVE